MAIYTSSTFYGCIEGAAKLAVSFGNAPNVKTLVFCEDKLTLSLELAIARLGGGTFAAEVCSFGRYVQKNAPKAPALGKEGAAMAVKKVMSALSDKLVVLGGLKSSPALASGMSELIAQLKSAKVTPQMLQNCLQDCPANISAKIGDIALIFEGYESFLAENSLTDSNNSLALMPSLVQEDEKMSQTHVIIAGYSSVTRQSCDVIKSLFNYSLTCDFFAVAGDNEDLYTGEFLKFIKTVDGTAPIKIDGQIKDEIKALSDNLYNPSVFSKIGLYSDKVSIFEGKTQVEEIEQVALRIRQEVIENGRRYKDIAVGVGNIEGYALDIKRIFKDYSIPAFIDAKRKLSEHPLAKLIETISLLPIYKYDIKTVKEIFSNSAFLTDKPTADLAIRLLTVNSITGKTFFDRQKNIVGLDDDLILSTLRSALISLLSTLKRKDTVENYLIAIRGFLQVVGAQKNLSIVESKLSNIGEDEEVAFNAQAYDKIQNVLCVIEDILGGEVVTCDEFSRIFSSGANACEISIIPEYADGVYVSEIKNCRFKKYGILFAVGLNGDIPGVKADTAILPDGDIGKLDKLSVSVEPKIRVVNEREKEAVCLALLSFSDKLCMSYSLLSPSGKQIAKSQIITYAEAIFSSDKKRLKAYDKKSVELGALKAQGQRLDRLQALNYLSILPALKSLLGDSDDYKNGAIDDLEAASSFYAAIKKYQNGKYLDIADRLLSRIDKPLTITANLSENNYFPRGELSTSLLETFYSCPYKNFAKYGLKLADSLTAEVRALDFGNILHAVVENFVKVMDEEGETVRQKVEKIYAEIIVKPEYSRFLQRADYAYTSKLVLSECVRACERIKREFENSMFVPVGEEIWFSDWGEYKPIKLNTQKGQFKLRGKVDRVDKFGDYVRIIDYKTGNVDEKIKNVNLYTGQNLQAYLYLKAVTANGDKPAGSYYYALNDNYKGEDDDKFTMYGKTLNERKIIDATDPKIMQGKVSDVVNVKKKVTKSKGESIDGNVSGLSQMYAYMEYAKALAEKGAEMVADGVVIPSPYDGACDYCEYHGLCGYDREYDDRTRKFSKIEDSVIINAVNPKADGNSGDLLQEKEGGEGND